MRARERVDRLMDEGSGGGGASEPIVLMGHSLGAFVSAHYALSYPERLKQLILCSPVGFPEAPATSTLQARVDAQPTYLRKFAVRRYASLWEGHTSPFTLLRATGRVGANSLLNNYVSRRMGISDAEE